MRLANIHRHYWYILGFYLVAGVIYYFLFDFIRWDNKDSQSFIEAARLLFGLEGSGLMQSRITKPIPLLLPGLLLKYGQVPVYYSLILQQYLLFFASGIMMYKSALAVRLSRKEALAAALMLCMCGPFAIFSTFPLSDTFGYFFIIGSIWLGVKLCESKSNWFPVLAGFFIGLGVLSKASALIGLLACMVILFWSVLPLAAKLRRASLLALGFVLIVLPVQFLIFEKFGVTIISRIAYTHEHEVGYALSFDYIKQLGRTIEFYWLLIPVAVISAIRIRGAQGFYLYKTMISIIGILVLTAPFFTEYIYDRILFGIAPFALLLLVTGQRLLKSYFWYVIGLYGIGNIAMAFAVYYFQIEGLLLVAYGVYGVLSIILFGWLVWRGMTQKPENS